MQTTAPTRLELNNADLDGSVVLHALTLPISANAAGAASSGVTVQVVPPPGPDGLLPGRDRRRQRVPDVRAFAAKLNRQDPKARVDTDHRSEPASPTFIGETAAGGWLSNYRPNSDGGIDADMELGEDLRGRLRRKEYRYISPAYLLGAGRRGYGTLEHRPGQQPQLSRSMPRHCTACNAARPRSRCERPRSVAGSWSCARQRGRYGDSQQHHRLDIQRDYFLDTIEQHAEVVSRPDSTLSRCSSIRGGTASRERHLWRITLAPPWLLRTPIRRALYRCTTRIVGHFPDSRAYLRTEMR